MEKAYSLPTRQDLPHRSLSRSSNPSSAHESDKEYEDKEMTAVVYAAPKSPSTHNLNNLEFSYLKYYFDILLPHFIEERNRPDKGHTSDVILRRFGHGFDSKSVRAAAILYAYTFQQFENLDSSQIDEYRQQFYSLTRAALAKKSYAEVVYASHLFCLHGFLAGLPFSEIAKHVNGFLLGVRELQRDDSLSGEETFLLRCMCKDLFCWMTSSGVERQNEDVEDEGERIPELFRLSQIAQPIFEPGMELGDEPEWRKTSESYLRIQMLLYRLQIAFDYFNFKRSSSYERNDEPWFEQFAFLLSNNLSELVSVIQENPQIRSMTDCSGLFGEDSFQKLSAAYPHDPSEREWLHWQPSLIAHYKSSLTNIWNPNLKKPSDEGVSIEAIEAGLSVCRIIEPNESKKSKITCISALRSLVITFWLNLRDEQDPGSRSPKTPYLISEAEIVREIIRKHFNLQKYLSLRARESPILKHYEEVMTAVTPPEGDDALEMDKGGFLDCMGRLRADVKGCCPHCGRLTCDLRSDGKKGQRIPINVVSHLV